MALLNFAGAPHGGRVQLLPENASAPRIVPRLIVLHTIVGGARGAERYFRTGTNLESHFVIAGRWAEGDWPDGYIVQLMDTARRADAQYHANGFAISFETGDDGTPDDTPWTPAQLDSIDWLARRCAAIHRIPLRRADRWDGSGVGFHTMWGAPSQWTPVEKNCPGRARIRQFSDVVLPRLARPAAGGGDMAGADDILDAIADLRRDLTVYGTRGLEETVEAFAQRQRDALKKLDELLARPPVDSGGDDGPAPVVVRLADDQLATLKAEVLAELRAAMVELALPEAIAQATANQFAGRLQS